MTKVEIEFLEEYKRLDRLCQDMLSTLQGVSEYINRMELLFEQGEEFVDEWTINYKMLKHLRWLRTVSYTHLYYLFKTCNNWRWNFNFIKSYGSCN